MFTLVMQKRDVDGNPTGKVISVSSEKSQDISRFYVKNRYRKPWNKK